MMNGFNVLFFIVFLLEKELSATITHGPSNTVAENGEQVKLYCTATVAIGFWLLSKNGVTIDEVIIAGPGCLKLNPDFADHYAVELLGGGKTCNLIVFNITTEQAGVYRCSDGPTQTLSILTVTDSSPVITVNNTSDTITVVENESVLIECVLNHSGSMPPAPTLRPYFYWKDIHGHNVSSTYNSMTNDTAASQLTVIAGRQNITSYTCHVYLQLIPPTTPNYAINTPTVNSSASSSVIEVLYNPSTPTIGLTSSGIACETIILTCNSIGNPLPKYKWFYWDKTVIDVISEGQSLTLTEVNQSYIICEAYNTIRNVKYTASANYNVSQSDFSSNCNTGPNSPGKTDLITTIVLAAVLGGYGLCNIIATIVFLVYYNRKSNTESDDKEMSTFINKSKLNARFPWLQRMLPCMNEPRENVGCTFLWVILFILMFILAGIIVFPILVAMVNCSRKRKNSKENSDIGMSNQQRSKTAGTPSTAAHGDFEDPYDEIKTMRHDRKQTLEEPTSVKNTKDAKKVFYTRVNPNLNTGEDIERYSVPMPSGSPEL